MTRFLPGLLLLATACAATPRPVKAPDGYTPIHRGEYDWRAMSPEGVVLGTRGFGQNQKGDLAFWCGVVRKELENSKGYKYVSMERIGDEKMPGRMMLFTQPMEPDRICYAWVFLGASGVH